MVTKVTIKLSAKQAKGLAKLAKVWGVTPEEALKRLLDNVIEQSL